MKKIELSLLGLAISQSPDSYIVLLKDGESEKRLPIIVGTNEAQSIAVAIDNLRPPRPLTHDAFFNVMEYFEIDLKEVYIYDIVSGIFHARMLCERHGKVQQFDVRSSDAIAMALRFRVPIYTNEIVLNVAVVLPSPSKYEEKTGQKNIVDMSSEEIQLAIEDAVKKEDYETASLLRDVLKQKK
jgi:bifunctional DNase/RNase